LQINKKSEAHGQFEFSPFNYNLNDESLITLNTTLANTVSFNRQSPVWGLDITNLRNNGKTLLTYGYESRKNNDWNIRYRHFFSRTISFNLNAVKGFTALYTQASQFENRNYEIKTQSAEPSFSYIRGTNFRITGSYKFEEKNNAKNYGGEKAISHSVTAETKYNLLQSLSATGKFTFENLNYTSAQNAQTTVAYIMLDGLTSGKNFLWNFMLIKRLMNNLELNFQYDGRKPGTGKTIHTGRVSLTALF
jgi:hypothetical protein